MSEGILRSAKLDTDALPAQPLAKQLVVMSQRSVQAHAVVSALAAAEALQPGLIITSEDAAVGVVDAVATVIQGEKALAADMAELLRVPKALEAAVRQAFATPMATLKAAKERGNLARVAFQQELRRRAAAIEAQQREDARKAAEAAAAAARDMGEDDEIPEAEVAPIVVARTVTAGKASSGTTVRLEATEIVDDAACPAEWKQIIRMVAEASFRAAEMGGRVKRAAPGESVIFKGVRFVSVERAANRS